MQIKNMFAKQIDRDIKGVIKVGQGDDANVQQELSEYVVTRELQKHFADFFANYKTGIVGNTDKMGVWISGFFGSGKSHFLKILSYLLDNREVDGKRAIDYFVEDKKITDPYVLADMKLAADTPADVILFNIDSKSEIQGKQSKDAIVSVLLRVFNGRQGFCESNSVIADLERTLSEKGQYDNFKAEFESINGSPWLEARNEFDFIQDDVVDALVAIDFMSEEAARNWCEKAMDGIDRKSIEDFAKLIKRYIDQKGENHHVVFLIDEIGQYIGDSRDLMLNLQTVTEDLGTACQGKAWIIVTSQQDIDSVAKEISHNKNDFSKIQGRFDTRLSLSSANVDEVIRKRILEKNDAGHDTLALLYDQKETDIKNKIIFNDGVEKKLYTNRENFAAVYPFVPYQFNLLGSVLTSIRTHGASGKHLAEGERSMLALFKDSAERLMNENEGALVPFNMFSIIKDGQYIGYCGIKNTSQEPWEIAIEILPDWTNQGIGRIAIDGMLDAVKARLGINQFRVRIDPGNHASQKMFEKLGAIPNGISEFLIHDKATLEKCEEDNLHLIDADTISLAGKFGVEPRKLLSHILEYSLPW